MLSLAATRLVLINGWRSQGAGGGGGGEGGEGRGEEEWGTNNIKCRKLEKGREEQENKKKLRSEGGGGRG